MLKATGAAVVGLAGVATPSVAAGGACAPGAGLARMVAKVKAGVAPCAAGCAQLTVNPHAQRSCTARPQVIV